MKREYTCLNINEQNDENTIQLTSLSMSNMSRQKNLLVSLSKNKNLDNLKASYKLIYQR